jgi:hypothetical protein
MDQDPAPAPTRRRWLRRLLWATGVLTALLLVLAYFLPYLLKRYIETHSVAWIQRQVRIERIVLNPFTFTYGVHGVVCHEPGSEEVFVSWKRVELKADLWNAWRNNAWRFRALRIDDPYVHITQRGDRFNFSDLLELGGGDTAAPDPADTSSVLFEMADIQLSNGRIAYEADLLKAPAVIQDLNARCDLITSESARMAFDLSCALANGGRLDGGFIIDTDRSLYEIDGRLKAFALPQLLPYLQDFMHTTALQGEVDLDLHLRDSWADSSALAVRAELGVSGLDITDGEGGELIGLRSARVRLDTLDARSERFDLRSIVVDGFHTRFQLWADGGQTWSKVLKLDSTATAGDTTVTLAASEDNVFVMLADYIRMLGQDLVANEYNADSLAFTDATLHFEDFTPERSFRYTLDQLNVTSTRMNSAQGTVDLQAEARLNQRGRVQSVFRFDPQDFRNVDATLAVEEMALADLDAYGRWYGAHPINSGTLRYTGHTRIQEGKLQSENHLQAQQLKLGRKVEVHDPDIYVLPLRLAVGLLKDVKGNIDLDVPVEGDVRDPKFRPWPIVRQVLKNLLVKAVTAPGRLIGRALGGGEEELEEVRFEALATALGKEQRKALDGLAKGLSAKPDLAVALVPLMDVREEGEELAAFLLKREHLALAEPLSATDSARIMALSTRDSAFVAFLDLRAPDTRGQAERQRCVALVGTEVVQARVAELEHMREAAVAAALTAAGLQPPRYAFRPGTPEETSGRRGRPGYAFIFDAADDPGSTP